MERSRHQKLLDFRPQPCLEREPDRAGNLADAQEALLARRRRGNVKGLGRGSAPEHDLATVQSRFGSNYSASSLFRIFPWQVLEVLKHHAARSHRKGETSIVGSRRGVHKSDRLPDTIRGALHVRWSAVWR